MNPDLQRAVASASVAMPAYYLMQLEKRAKTAEIQRDRLVRLIRDVLATELDLSIEWQLTDIDTGQPLADIERKLDSGLRRLRRAVDDLNNIKSPRGME